MCLGMHFALMEVRATLFQLLRRYEFRLPPGHSLSMRTLPFPVPDDGLPLQIERIG
jgi:cytochrome P450